MSVSCAVIMSFSDKNSIPVKQNIKKQNTKQKTVCDFLFVYLFTVIYACLKNGDLIFTILKT